MLGGSRVFFRCDASTQMGGGHLMRCLTLANALLEAGAEVSFVTAQMPEVLRDRIAGAGHRVETIPASPEMDRTAALKWEEPPLSADAQLADANAAGSAIGQADWLVVDHYLLDAQWHLAARSFADHILVIDDLANRSYECDILLDQTFGRSAVEYRNLVPERCRTLAGSNYAILRPEFGEWRAAALDRRERPAPVGRVLISLGSTDVGAVSAAVLEAVRAPGLATEIDVVIGAEAESLAAVEAAAAGDRSIHVHVDTREMAQVMTQADLAIGAAGSSSWERCCLGLPTITLVLAGNQGLVAANLERAGAVVVADSPEVIGELLRTLADNEQMRLSMVAAAAAIVDGHGAKRIVEAMAGVSSAAEEEPTLRPARPQDSRIVWLWRNDLMTRQFSQATAPIAWPDHEAWWQRSRESADRELLIAEVAGVPVAALRFDRVGGGFEVSINLAPSARNSGLGGRVLATACTTFRDRHGPVRLFATIHRDNPASRRIFEKLGFVRVGDLSDSAFERYVFAEGTAE